MLHKFSLVEYRYMHIYILFSLHQIWMTQLRTSHHLTFRKNLQSRYWTWIVCKDPNSLAKARFPADSFQQWRCRRFTNFHKRWWLHFEFPQPSQLSAFTLGGRFEWREKKKAKKHLKRKTRHVPKGYWSIWTHYANSAHWPVDVLPWKNIRFHRHRCLEWCQTVNANRRSESFKWNRFEAPGLMVGPYQL